MLREPTRIENHRSIWGVHLEIKSDDLVVEPSSVRLSTLRIDVLEVISGHCDAVSAVIARHEMN
jgi:hypothetical protein